MPRLRAFAVHFANGLGLARNVERIRGIHLHAISKFERLHARFEARIGSATLGMLLVELLQEIELGALFIERERFIFDVLDEFLDVLMRRVDVRALEDSGQKRALPVLRLLNWITGTQ